MNKSYKKSEGVYVLDTEQGQYTADENNNTVVPSSYTATELEAMEPDFFGGNITGIIQNYVIKLNALVTLCDQLNLEGQ